MAGPRVTLVFDGDSSRLESASRRSESALERLDKKIGSIHKQALLGGAGLGAMGAGIGAALPAVGALGAGMGVTALALNGASDAMTEYNKALESGDWEDYNKLLAKMSPAQRDFQKALISTKEPLDQLQKTAAAGVLPGFGAAIAGAITMLPTLDAAVARTSKIVGDTGTRLGELFKTEKFKTDLDAFFKATEPVTSAIGNSMVTLTEKTVAFAAKMAPAGEGFATFVTKVTEGFTGMLDKLTPHADSFKRIWESLGLIFEILLPIIGQAAGAFADQLAPALEKAAIWLRDHQGLVTWVITNLPLMILAFDGLKTVATLIKGVTTAWKLMSLAMMINPWVLLIAAVLLIAYVIYSNWDAIKGYLLATWNWIKSTATSIWNNIKNFFSTTWNSIKSIFSGAVNGIKGILNWFGELPGRFRGWIGSAKDAVVERFNSMVGWVRGLPGMILGALGNLGSLLWNSGQSLITGLWNGISSAIGWVKSKISGALSSIRNLFPFSPAKEGPFSGRGYTTYSGKALATDFGKGIQNGLPGVLASVNDLMGAANTSFNGQNIFSSGGSSRTPAAPVVNLYVQGSIRSDKDLIKVIRDEMQNGGFRGLVGSGV